MKLNLGCGTKTLDGYVNIDMRATKPNVIIGDVKCLKYPPNSIEEIYANDVYEHIEFAKSKELLRHWVSLLRPGGKLVMQTPSILGLLHSMEKQNTTEGIESIIRKTFGGQDYKYNYHYTAGHPTLMVSYLREAGITGNIDIVEKSTNMRIVAIK